MCFRGCVEFGMLKMIFGNIVELSEFGVLIVFEI